MGRGCGRIGETNAYSFSHAFGMTAPSGRELRLTTRIGETNSFSHAFGMTAPSRRELQTDNKNRGDELLQSCLRHDSSLEEGAQAVNRLSLFEGYFPRTSGSWQGLGQSPKKGFLMTLQQLKYVVEVAERGSITEAAKALFIAQPSLSAAVRELEEEAGITIFLRNSRGILLTQEGAEFLGYARQVVQQAALIEDKYIAHSASRQRFSVSTQHYSFTSSAFVELVRAQGGQSYEFVLREGKTYDTIMDVRHLRSEMGVIYLCSFNEAVIRKTLRESNLVFSELFSARPHIFIGRNNPLAGRKSVNMKDLESLPCLTYEQGDQNSFYFSEEILSTLNHEKSIKVTDKGTIIDLMTGTDGYTISSGICPSYLRGDDIISIPLEVEEIIRIGVITHKDYRPTALGQMYLDILHRVVGDMQGE